MSRALPRFHRSNPPLPSVGTTNGVVLYRMIGSLEGQLTVTTFYFSSGVAAPTPAQLTTLLTNISTNLANQYATNISSDWTITRETLDVVHRADLAGVLSTARAGQAGGRAGGHLPTENAMVLVRYTAVKGQHGRGRIGLPPPAPADVTASRVSAAGLITTLNTLATQMLVTASDGANTWTPCSVQRATVPPKLVVGFSPLTRIVVNTLLGTVRRRKIGRGK